MPWATSSHSEYEQYSKPTVERDSICMCGETLCLAKRQVSLVIDAVITPTLSNQVGLILYTY